MRSVETVPARCAAARIALIAAGRERIAKSRRELRRAKHPQRILFERLVAHDVDAPRSNIVGAAVWIDQLAGRQRPRQHVHAEISARKIVFERDLG